MEKFKCLILDSHQKKSTIFMEAKNSKILKEQLKEKKIILISFKEVKKGDKGDKTDKATKINLKKITKFELLTFSHELGIMLESGLNLSQALTLLKNEITNPNLTFIISEIITSIKKGDALSSAIEPFKVFFGELYINMIIVGEASGTLPKILSIIASNMKKEEFIKKKIKNILLYPVITIVLALILGTLLIAFVLPEFIKIFKESHQQLPFITLVLLNIYTFTKSYFLFIMIFFILFILYIYKFFKSTKGRKSIYKFLNHNFLCKKIYRKYTLILLLRNFFLLLNSGISIFKAFKLLIKIENNPTLKLDLINILHALKKGATISDSFKSSIFFNQTTIIMISIGESSGNLSEMVENASEFAFNQFNHTVDYLLIIIEPLIVVFLGIFIGTIVLGLYLPMFNIISIIK